MEIESIPMLEKIEEYNREEVETYEYSVLIHGYDKFENRMRRTFVKISVSVKTNKNGEKWIKEVLVDGQSICDYELYTLLSVLLLNFRELVIDRTNEMIAKITME